ncbi:hypothetical protein V6N13_099484 [Hibiscus sabdariffa]|uniref:Uncharacterized protein n=1 Tax=Hibiscus sabdariffa TaxID=183260 RepID=A0ABR2PZS7_9ROSI
MVSDGWLGIVTVGDVSMWAAEWRLVEIGEREMMDGWGVVPWLGSAGVAGWCKQGTTGVLAVHLRGLSVG